MSLHIWKCEGPKKKKKKKLFVNKCGKTHGTKEDPHLRANDNAEIPANANEGLPRIGRHTKKEKKGLKNG